MKLSTIGLAWSLVSVASSTFRSDLDRLSKRQRLPKTGHRPNGIFKREASTSEFLTNASAKYAVTGTGFPLVDFDLGESYAGLIPIGNHSVEDKSLFFWFFPSPNDTVRKEKEIVIWLNGGPGCSSLVGFLSENGPMNWAPGTMKPVPNPWSWHLLSNVVWIEQPIGVGFSQGNGSDIHDEDTVAEHFMGFWKNFVDVFALKGYKVYVTGESYAGYYGPYISYHMLQANDTDYFNVAGLLMYDPIFVDSSAHNRITSAAYVDHYRAILPLNNTFTASLHRTADACGFGKYLDDYLVFPPKGPQPSNLQSSAPGNMSQVCDDLYWAIYDALIELNPCFDLHKITTMCPFIYEPLSLKIDAAVSTSDVFFAREDVKKAIHAPSETKWSLCAPYRILDPDLSEPPSLSILPSVIDRTQNVVIANGALDFLLQTNGSLLVIQNMTWGGQLGFQKRPSDSFYVPKHMLWGENQEPYQRETWTGMGIMGFTHTERGLTFVGVDLAGHKLPADNPGAAFRHLEFFLGRVDSLSSRQPFTIYPFPQTSDQ